MAFKECSFAFVNRGVGRMSKFEVPPLSYAYNALEPYIDEQTMKIHHDKHHQAYVDKLNAALDGNTEWRNKGIEDILKNVNSVPENIRTAVRNHGGGHYNHSLFWQMMAPKAGGKPSGDLGKTIDKDFGSFEEFKKQFSAAAVNRFGSGWAWLAFNDGKLEVVSTANQDNPLSEGKVPLLGIDVWEHSYYLKYQNRRAEYVEAFYNVVNWKKVDELYQHAKK